MTIKRIITDEKLLSKKSVDINLDSEELEKIIDDLLDTAEENRNSKMGCAGLAASQIGYYYRICVVRLGHCYEPIINPKVIKKGGRVIKGSESCLSRPNKPPIEKMRFQRITVEYINSNKEVVRNTFHWVDARVLQHEMDHFDGKLI